MKANFGWTEENQHTPTGERPLLRSIERSIDGSDQFDRGWGMEAGGPLSARALARTALVINKCKKLKGYVSVEGEENGEHMISG